MNTDQLNAANSASEWVLVKAGPGSGKTKTLTERAARLSETFRPSQMAFCTFTNVGASVLRKRLKDRLGEAPGFVGTLHAMMWGLIRTNCRGVALVNEEEAEIRINRAARTLGYRGSKDALTLAAQEDAPGGDAGRVVAFYRRELRDLGLFDFSTVLVEGYRLVKERGLPWPCLFVDEFQDSGPIDAKIYLAANPARFFVVGDVKQSIFGFRGARPRNMDDYEASGRFDVHTLGLNYRSTAEICDLANGVISLTSLKGQPPTIAATPEKATIEIKQHESELHELAWVLDRVTYCLAQGVQPNEIAVLMRTNALRSSVAENLAMNGIPLAIDEGEKRPKDWRLLQRILAFMVSPENRASGLLLAREISKARGVDQDATEKAFNTHADKGDPVADYFRFPDPALVLRMNASFASYGIGKASEKLLASYIRTFTPDTLAELSEIVREGAGVQERRGVVVTTAHGAKGDEWQAVVVPGLDLFRSSDLDRADEEMRLAFVAITRAKRMLFMSQTNYRTFRMPGGRSIVTPTSAGSLYYDLLRLVEAKKTEAAS